MTNRKQHPVTALGWVPIDVVEQSRDVFGAGRSSEAKGAGDLAPAWPQLPRRWGRRAGITVRQPV